MKKANIIFKCKVKKKGHCFNPYDSYLFDSIILTQEEVKKVEAAKECAKNNHTERAEKILANIIYSICERDSNACILHAGLIEYIFDKMDEFAIEKKLGVA